MNELAAPPAAGRVKRNLPWITCLVVGSLLWLGALVITDVTNDPILIPTVILLGSFVVPLTVVVFAMSRERADRLPPMVMFLGFIAGGTIGVLSSALLETYYLPHGKGTYLSVGLIEEAAKALVVAGGRPPGRRSRPSRRNGPRRHRRGRLRGLRDVRLRHEHVAASTWATTAS